METNAGLGSKGNSAVDTPNRRGGIVFPVILICAGIVFLLTNLGLVDFSIWSVLLRLWPVLLIAVGLDILVGRHSIWGSLLVVVLLFAVLGGAIVLTGTGRGLVAGEPLTSEQVAQPLRDAKAGVVEISPGAAELHIDAAAEGAGLVQGQVAIGRGENVRRDAYNEGSTLHFTLRSQGAPAWFPGQLGGPDWQGRQWDLQLTRDIPLSLKLNMGVGRSTIDLSRLSLTDLDVNGGIGQTTLTLPQRGKVTASVDAGIGDVTIIIPAGTAASIRADGGLGKTDVQGNFQRQGDRYESPNYGGAANQINLRVNGGIGRIVIQQPAGG